MCSWQARFCILTILGVIALIAAAMSKHAADLTLQKVATMALHAIALPDGSGRGLIVSAHGQVLLAHPMLFLRSDAISGRCSSHSISGLHFYAHYRASVRRQRQSFPVIRSSRTWSQSYWSF